MTTCPESARRAAMTDAEFWDHVFGGEVHGYDSYEPDIHAIDCARCGELVEVDDPENRERDAFCDDCADETVPELEEVL